MKFFNTLSKIKPMETIAFSIISQWLVDWDRVGVAMILNLTSRANYTNWRQLPVARGAIYHIIDAVIDPWTEKATDCVHINLLTWLNRNYLYALSSNGCRVSDNGNKLSRSWAAKSLPMVSKNVLNIVDRWNLFASTGEYYNYVFSLATATTWHICYDFNSSIAGKIMNIDDENNYICNPYLIVTLIEQLNNEACEPDIQQKRISRYERNVIAFAYNLCDYYPKSCIDILCNIFRAHAMSDRENSLLIMAADLCKYNVSVSIIEKAALRYVNNGQFIRRLKDSIHSIDK